MKRCQLGDGFVNFKEILYSLKDALPMTIELGAFNSREADINISEYWESTLGVNEFQKENFMKFINENVNNNSEWKTEWESGSNPDSLVKLEMSEIINSVNYLKSL